MRSWRKVNPITIFEIIVFGYTGQARIKKLERLYERVYETIYLPTTA